MKHLYIILLLAFPMTLIHAQDELILNQGFDTDASNWTATNQAATPASGWDGTVDRNGSTTSGSFRLSEDTGSNAHIKHDQFSAATMKGVGGAGDYVISFWIYGAQGNRVKVQISNGAGVTVKAEFTENLAKNSGVDQPEITAIQTANTWQFVTTTVTLANTWATLKIFSITGGSTTYLDDISVKRSVSEMPASGDFTSGWYPNNATSTVDSNTGIHTLNMDNSNPQLKSWDYTVNADVSKILTIQLKNNSVNDALTVMHPKSDGTGTRYYNTTITTNDAAVQTYAIDLTNSNWAGTMYPITLYVRQSNGSGGYTTANQSGTVEFHAITVSPTASVDENYKSNIVLYPNPADTYFIAENAAANDKLEIYNVAGKLVKSLSIQSNNERISIEDLSSGIYFAKINESNALRLIKK
ncbi:MAG: Uncharacterised protein [Bacteroidota bacterium]|nr:MAG: Uncharacterised protein [Bacteroidota bacterium]